MLAFLCNKICINKNFPEYLKSIRFEVDRKKKSYFFLYLSRIVIFGFAIFIVWLGFLAGNTMKNIGKIFSPNEFGGSPFIRTSNLSEIKLRGEGDGRINFLIVGYGGEEHEGGFLTDTIIVASLDPINKTASMLSIPRDLWVSFPKNSCQITKQKINAVYPMILACSGGKNLGEREKEANRVLKETVGNLLDLNIHYLIKVDFKGFERVIDIIGGVDLCLESSFYDPYYPNDRYGYDPFFLEAGCHTLDGKTTLKYARSRQTSSDFARAKRQQEIIIAAKEKFLKLENLFNPAKISNLVEELSDNIRTDFESIDEIWKIVQIGRSVDQRDISMHVLDDSENGFLYGTSVVLDGYNISILLPNDKTGEEIKEFAQSIFKEPFLRKEDAKIIVLNGTYYTGLATKMKDKISVYGYNVIKVSNAKERGHKKTRIFSKNLNKKRITEDLLSKRIGKILGIPSLEIEEIPADFTISEDLTEEEISGMDILVVVGEDFALI